MNPEVIKSYMSRKVRDTGYVKDYSGKLETDAYVRVPLPGSSNASEGETFTYLRRGCTDHLVVMFMGGGLSWNEKTAKYGQNPETITDTKIPALYSPAVDEMTEFSIFALTKRPGILTLGKENPFRNWNVAVINYVTGDFHLGDNDLPYTDAEGKPQVLHHRGYSYFHLALEQIKAFFPKADKLLIAGGSAGGFAVPALAGELMDAYQDCKDVTAFSDSSFVLLDCYRETAEKVWHAPNTLTEAIQTNDVVVDWFSRLYALKGDSIRYLYANSCRDYLLTTFQNYIDNGTYSASKEQCQAFTSELKNHIGRLKEACPPMLFHINNLKAAAPNAKGTEHCLLLNDNFFKPVQGEKACVEWLCQAMEGNGSNVGLSLLEERKK